MLGIGKYFTALWYLMTFRVSKATKALQENPGVISEGFKDLIRRKRESANQFVEAISGMVHMLEDKKRRLKTLCDEIVELTELQDGAAAMAQEVVARHKGDQAAVHADPEYQECATAYEDFSSTLAEKQQRKVEYESDIAGLEERVRAQKLSLQSIKREIDRLREPTHHAES